MTVRLAIAATKSALCALLLGAAGALAGPYSAPWGDPTNPHDAPVPGFVGPHGDGRARVLESGGVYANPDNFVNPVFAGWASGTADYAPAPGVGASWTDPASALGPVTGDNFHIVSLGDLSATQIAGGVAPGTITLTFDQPICDRHGADFVCFENGLISAGGAGVANQILAELVYVEVSSDGVNFARMPSRSLTPAPVGSFGTIDASNVFGLAGKHVNAYGESWGTPFDLAWVASDPLVTSGLVDLDAITHIRLVDIPGNGAFADSQAAPIHDAWLTMGSSGHDLEAVGVISHDLAFETWQDRHGLLGEERGGAADPDRDGLPNLIEYAAGLVPRAPEPASSWQSVSVAGRALSLRCQRDERATDLVLEVEASADLRTWEVIARSTGGAPFAAVAPHVPGITETSAHPVASVGVLRAATITDTSATMRFMRLRVHTLP